MMIRKMCRSLIIWKKYFFCCKIEGVVAQSARQISLVILAAASWEWYPCCFKVIEKEGVEIKKTKNY